MPEQRCSYIIIAIDGPAGAGKSTVARCLARRLGYQYVDSGALYRAVGWLAHARALPLDDAMALVACLEQTPIDLTFCDGIPEVWVAGQCVTSQLRGETVGYAASVVATMPGVRQVLTAQLRQWGCRANLVIEGRDIGTVVFPDATVKFFLDAAPAVRSQRRLQEMQQAGQNATLGQVVEAMARRDSQDRTRAAAPLVPAREAYSIDTTDLTVDEIVRIMLSEIRRALPGGGEEAGGAHVG
jgi:cytidylate kinase